MFGFGKKKTVVIKVDGMHCINCANKVVKALTSLDGVSKAAVSLEEKNVTVICKENFDTAKASESINALGFKVIE